MALHGEVKINGTDIYEWSAVRQSRRAYGLNEYEWTVWRAGTDERWTGRLKHETSLAAVAQQAGLTRLTVEKFINRETVPHINTLGKLDNLIYAWENGALTLKGKDIFRKGSVRP